MREKVFGEGDQKQRADERAAQHRTGVHDEGRGPVVQDDRARWLQDGREVPAVHERVQSRYKGELGAVGARGFGEAGEGELHGRRVTRDDWEVGARADFGEASEAGEGELLKLASLSAITT